MDSIRFLEVHSTSSDCSGTSGSEQFIRRALTVVAKFTFSFSVSAVQGFGFISPDLLKRHSGNLRLVDADDSQCKMLMKNPSGRV